MADLNLQTGGTLRAVLAEVGESWKATEAGQPFAPSRTVSFVDWAALCGVLTPKRFDLLRHVRQHPAPSIRALARAVGRDVKRVHQDVTALAELGLLSKHPTTGAISTDLDEVASTIKFAA